MSDHNSDAMDAILHALPPGSRRLVEAARRTILDLVPHAVEGFRPGWGLIGYNVPRYFAFIVPKAGRVRIGFEWGVRLRDPEGALEGSGSQVRHLTISSIGDLRRPVVDRLILEAAELAGHSTG